jgi:uncharacterized protein YndB with AHSA1/START domain
MQNFDWTQFTRKIAVKASMTQLYDAWTKAQDIEKWFLSEAKYYDTAKSPIPQNMHIEKGNTYAWNWYLFPTEEHGSITEANGKDFLQFTFAGDCLVDIQLTQYGEHVIVSLTHKNIPTDDQSKQNIRLGCDTGWSFYLVNLKSVYEGGLDLRNKDAALNSMLNM